MLLLASVHPLLLLLPLFGLPALLLSSKTGALFRLGNERAAEPAAAARITCTSSRRTRRPGQGGAAVPARRRAAPTVPPDAAGDPAHPPAGQCRRPRPRALVGRIAFLLGYFGAIVFVVGLAVDGRATVGDAVLTAVLAGQVLGLVTGSADLIQLGVPHPRHGGPVRPPQRRRSADAAARRQTRADPDRLTDGIRLEHVSYRYPLAPADVAARRQPATCRPAATVAIVGDNGAGKTTLVKLLAGLYLPDRGPDHLDGVDLHASTPSSGGNASRPDSRTTPASSSSSARPSASATSDRSTTPPQWSRRSTAPAPPTSSTRCLQVSPPSSDRTGRRASTCRADSGRSSRSAAR